MAKLKNTEATAKIVDVLTPFESAERQRIVHAVLTLLGESSVPTSQRKSDAAGGGDEHGGSHDASAASLPAKAKNWAKQNKLTSDEIQQVFHVENGVATVIAAAMPGKKKRGQTINAYVLRGIAALLSSGEASFDDKSAREVCNAQGCYDGPNHAVTMKSIGNKLTGSKDKGWTLTAPGLTYGAALIKGMTQAAE